MNILIDARLYGLENTGIGRYLINLIDHLQIIDKKNNYTILIKSNYFNRLKLTSKWTKVKCDIPHYSFKEQIYLPKVIRSLKPDIVHFPHINVPLMYKGNEITTVHDLTQLGLNNKATSLSKPLYLIKFIALKIVFRKAIKSKALIVPSSFVKEQLINYGLNKDKVFVVYEGFHPSSATFVNGKEVFKKYKLNNKYFVYVGNAYPHKNIERAIEAISRSNRERGDKIKFVVISARSNFTKKLETYVKKHGHKDVVILGFVPDNEIGIIIKGSLGFVYPSLSEGFGLPGLEAMGYGTPLLASNIPVFKEVFGDNVIYFNPHDPKSISESMNYVAKMPKDKRDLLIKKAKEHSRKYSWEQMAKETLAIYENVLS